MVNLVIEDTQTRGIIRAVNNSKNSPEKALKTLKLMKVDFLPGAIKKAIHYLEDPSKKYSVEMIKEVKEFLSSYILTVKKKNFLPSSTHIEKSLSRIDKMKIEEIRKLTKKSDIVIGDGITAQKVGAKISIPTREGR